MPLVVPGQHELAQSLPWGGTSHPVWFRRDPRVANCQAQGGVFNAALMHGVPQIVAGALEATKDMSAQERDEALTATAAQAKVLGKVFGLSLLATLVMALNLAAFIGPKASLGFGLFAGAATGLGWVAMSLGVIYLFEQRSLKLWLINSGYQVLAYTLMGGLLGVWK